MYLLFIMNLKKIYKFQIDLKEVKQTKKFRNELN